jgi:hypothetical protein
MNSFFSFTLRMVSLVHTLYSQLARVIKDHKGVIAFIITRSSSKGFNTVYQQLKE